MNSWEFHGSQWLGPHVLTAEGTSSILVGKLKSHDGTAKGKNAISPAVVFHCPQSFLSLYLVETESLVTRFSCFGLFFYMIFEVISAK